MLSKILKLAHQNPEIRVYLVPLIRRALAKQADNNKATTPESAKKLFEAYLDKLVDRHNTTLRWEDFYDSKGKDVAPSERPDFQLGAKVRTDKEIKATTGGSDFSLPPGTELTTVIVGVGVYAAFKTAQGITVYIKKDAIKHLFSPDKEAPKPKESPKPKEAPKTKEEAARQGFDLHEAIYDMPWRSTRSVVFSRKGTWKAAHQELKKLAIITKEIEPLAFSEARKYLDQAQKLIETDAEGFAIQDLLDRALATCHGALTDWAKDHKVYEKMQKEFEHA